jgi:saccharopine dehydrogenase (NAD+, L-lysine forming)
MKRVLIIGAGGVGSVIVHKCAQHPEIFGQIYLASRTKNKCDKIAQQLTKTKIQTAQIDADKPAEVIALINKFKPDILINAALPYQDLSLMEACLATGTNYLDTANYEDPDKTGFCYKEQWAYQKKYKQKGIMALLGCGFDPGVTNAFCAYAQKHLFDEIHHIDIMDCNGGEHGQPFATNFNPEINIREITQKGKYWENGRWIETAPLSEHRTFDFPEIGPREMYLMYHEELESLIKNIKGLKKIRFYMTFGKKYLTCLNVLQEIGMTNIQPIPFEGKQIVPLKFLKAVLPEPASLGKNYQGKTNIGCLISGTKNGCTKKIYIYNICDHAQCYKEVKAQAIAYTTGVPAMIGAMLMLTKQWNKAGVFNVEEFNPDPFMEKLNQCGLPWVCQNV